MQLVNTEEVEHNGFYAYIECFTDMHIRPSYRVQLYSPEGQNIRTFWSKTINDVRETVLDSITNGGDHDRNIFESLGPDKEKEVISKGFKYRREANKRERA